MRARKGDRKPLIVYTRDNKGNEHITVQSRDEGVVRAYIRDRRREAWAKSKWSREDHQGKGKGNLGKQHYRKRRLRARRAILLHRWKDNRRHR